MNPEDRSRCTALIVALCLLVPSVLAAASILAPPAAPGAATLPYVKTKASVIVLRHVRVIDGAGTVAKEDRTIILKDGNIAAVGDATLAAPDGAEVHDLSGHTVLPGLVGMHDHMFYIASPNSDAHGHSEPPLLVPQMTFSAPRLYLAAGVTTLRTTGSVETYADLNLKAMIDAGELPGPHLDVTGPYLEGPGSSFVQMRRLTDAEDARRFVEFWADEGVTSFKAYTNITRAQLKAAIDAAHKRGLKVTGHLCSVTYPEAASLGIDNLEHGFFVNTQNDPGKAPDICPPSSGIADTPGHGPRGPGSYRAHQVAGGSESRDHLHAPRARTVRARPCAARPARHDGADPTGARSSPVFARPAERRPARVRGQNRARRSR